MNSKRILTGFFIVMLCAGTMDNVTKPWQLWALFAVGLWGCCVAIKGVSNE